MKAFAILKEMEGGRQGQLKLIIQGLTGIWLILALAPVIRLCYGRMVLQSLPYTITMSVTGLLSTYFFM